MLRKKDVSFEKARDEFLKWMQANKRPNTAKSCKIHMRRSGEFFGGKNLGEISPFLIEKYKIKRIRNNCPVALNRELAYLRLMFNCFRKWKKYEGKNPVSGMRGPKESEGRTRILSEDDKAIQTSDGKVS